MDRRRWKDAYERRGHRFARYADDWNVYVRSQKAGERVMALLKCRYNKLHLKINKSKSAVASALGRKFLGYELWIARKGEVKRAVAKKALETFKQRIRQLTRRSGGRSIGHGLSNYVAVCWVGKLTSDWRKSEVSGDSLTNGCVIVCGRSNSSTGGMGLQSTVN